VVLPLLQNEVVATGWVSQADFLTGLALVQAMPGPLFNFAAYLGAHSRPATWHSNAALALDYPAFSACSLNAEFLSFHYFRHARSICQRLREPFWVQLILLMAGLAVSEVRVWHSNIGSLCHAQVQS